MLLRTERLLLREIRDSDAAFIFELVNDPDWLRFIGDKDVHSIQDARRYIAEGPCASYAQHGFGMYLAEFAAGGPPIGICGLVRRKALECADIGFALLPEFRGQGYAREAAAAVLEYSRAQLGMKKILGITLPRNAASIRLLERLGLDYERTISSDTGAELLAVYALSY